MLISKRFVFMGNTAQSMRDTAAKPDRSDVIPTEASSPGTEIWVYERKSYMITLWLVGREVIPVVLSLRKARWPDSFLCNSVHDPILIQRVMKQHFFST